mgnify:CR=1 FL=1
MPKGKGYKGSKKRKKRLVSKRKRPVLAKRGRKKGVRSILKGRRVRGRQRNKVLSRKR